MWQQAYVIEQMHGVAPRWHEDLRARMGWNGMHGALMQPGIMTSCSHVDRCVPFSWNTTSWTQMTQIMTPLVRPLAPTVELAQSIAPAGVLVHNSGHGHVFMLCYDTTPASYDTGQNRPALTAHMHIFGTTSI